MKKRVTLAALGALSCLVAGCARPGAPPPGVRPAAVSRAVVVGGTDFLSVPDGFRPPAPFTVAARPPVVRFVEYPFPHQEGRPWSHWGQGLVHSGGRVYTAVGDHRCLGATTIIYEYDPAAGILRAVADIFAAVTGVDHEHDYGFGKVHGRLSEGADGNIYLAGGQGTRRNRHLYRGSHLFRFEPATGRLVDLGLPLFGWHTPSTHFYREGMLFYAEMMIPPTHRGGNPERGYRDLFAETFSHTWRFMAYDLALGRVVFHGGKEESPYARDFFVDAGGNAWFNNGEGRLQRYCPRTGSIETADLRLPGNNIRRTAGPCPAGLLYATVRTAGGHVLFRFDPASPAVETIIEIGADTPGMALAPDGRFAYYVPGGKDTARWGVPLIQVDLAAGTQKVIAFLHEPVWARAGFNLGGTYSVMVSDDGAEVYIGFNGKKGSLERRFDDQALVAVGVPAEERR